ncbi:hypothetical protein, partial [Escherichia coli]
RAYCLKIQPATGSFARNLIYSTKPDGTRKIFDNDAKKSELLKLSCQVDTLLKAVGLEVNSGFIDATPLSEMRVYVGASSF